MFFEKYSSYIAYPSLSLFLFMGVETASNFFHGIILLLGGRGAVRSASRHLLTLKSDSSAS